MDYDAIDRDATLWGWAALQSEGEPWTIIELCMATGRPAPRTEGDLQSLLVNARAWKVRMNIDGEPFALEALRQADSSR